AVDPVPRRESAVQREVAVPRVVHDGRLTLANTRDQAVVPVEDSSAGRLALRADVDDEAALFQQRRHVARIVLDARQSMGLRTDHQSALVHTSSFPAADHPIVVTTSPGPRPRARTRNRRLDTGPLADG